MELPSIVEFAQEARTLPEVVEDFKVKINEGFKKVSEKTKGYLKLAYDLFFTGEGIPEEIKEQPTKNLIAGFIESVREDRGDWRDRVNMVRQIGLNLKINPVTVFIGLLVVALGITGVVELGKSFAKKGDNKNVRGSAIDRHRNSMKQFNIQNATTMHQMNAGQL